MIDKTWNPNIEDHCKLITLQAKSAGSRYADLTGGSLRWKPAIPAEGLFTFGNIDLRILCEPSPRGLRAAATEHSPFATSSTPTASLCRIRCPCGYSKANGKMSLSMSANGSSYNENNYYPSVLLTGVSGTAMWLRTTIELVHGLEGNITVKTWISPADDGIVWTQVGPILSCGRARSALHHHHGNALFEAGGEGRQSAGSPPNGCVNETQIRDGVNGPCITPYLPALWQRYVDYSTSYGGAPTLLLMNNFRSSSTMAYHANAARLKKETPDYGQPVSFSYTGHNEGSIAGQVEWLNRYKAWTEAVQHRLLTSTAAAVGQNPRTAPRRTTDDGSLHIQRIAQLSGATSC
ncbi:putative uncharacterized protein [Rhodococcus sp. AW25M09]|uniref:hypothetical protein n=1 Tax=Rhodococcus sp. AW25M09 TaxID=1268303 RepID=UPI0002AC95D5|nr:hypothetical protein [Rhodococcus sp. AW25M09]CCQ13632.1 putative uncharacterized protein [Rhodococcus sp. AW25M09]